MAGLESWDDFVNALAANSQINGETFKKAVDDIRESALQVSNVFGATRTRFTEITQAIADIRPRIERLGGDISQTTALINDVAKATGKNVLISAEAAEKLYAVTKLMGADSETLVENFAKAGINFQQVGKQLEGAMQYVNSIGLNTSQVMSTVSQYADELNRYNFEGGVIGLTKMAAQSTMLRSNMSSALSFADKVLDPSKAIEVASGFQRLGVSVGNLVDPFQLMNSSINDPAGLQKGLSDAVKQFSYFDEKSKTFKINPGAIMKIKELTEVTGYSEKELRNMAIAAREMDEIISNIDPSINIPEDDKMYLQNIARMNTQTGEYEVKVGSEYKKISEVSQQQMEELIKQQKDAPKTAEDMARNTMNQTTLIQKDVEAIRDAIVGGAATEERFQNNLEGVYRSINGMTGSISDEFAKSNLSRDLLSKYITNSKDFVKDLKSNPSDWQGAMSRLADKLEVTNDDMKNKLSDALKNAVTKMGEKITDKTAVERFVQNYGVEPTKAALKLPDQKVSYTKSSTDVNFNGSVDFNVSGTDGVSKQQLDSYVKSPEFKKEIMEIVKKHFKEMNLQK